MKYYKLRHDTHWGPMIAALDEANSICGLWFVGQKYEPSNVEFENDAYPSILVELEIQLEAYQLGTLKKFNLPLQFIGSEFQVHIWNLLLDIEYGDTTTYGEIAKIYAATHKKLQFSAQAVGGAVGRNPISIIVPCHRVVGAKGQLTGYAGGLDIKERLLALEMKNK